MRKQAVLFSVLITVLTVVGWQRELIAQMCGLAHAPAKFLVIDEDSIDNGLRPNIFTAADVNDDIAEIGVRAEPRIRVRLSTFTPARLEMKAGLLSRPFRLPGMPPVRLRTACAISWPPGQV